MNDKPSAYAFLPDYLMPADQLCFLNHDYLVALLSEAEAAKSFHQTFPFRDEADRLSFEGNTDVFAWLKATAREDDAAQLIRRTVFQALLSDFLHFVYEALSCSRKAKLAVSYALLRKPLQEHLALFEAMAIDLKAFAELLESNPLALRGQKAGGPDAHTRRIQAVLDLIDERDRFDAGYLTQLRYVKTDDGFDGFCNHAMHLFTEHPAIRTEPLNVNFIFSGDESRQSQWYYLYSRLPYILAYARRLIEYIYGTFETRVDPKAFPEVDRRVSAAVLLWYPGVDEGYRTPQLDSFVAASRLRLLRACNLSPNTELRAEALTRIIESEEALPA